MLLRLKQYTDYMYQRYYVMLDAIKPQVARSATDKLLLTSYASTGQTILFFNQSEPDRTFAEWSKDPNIPVAYQLKINHCLSLLIDSAFWGLNSCLLEYEEDKELFKVPLSDFRIDEDESEKDGLTYQFFNTCRMIHRVCPENTRMRECLIRLIWSYLTAKDLTNDARELTSYDRIEYLRRLTKYSL